MTITNSTISNNQTLPGRLGGGLNDSGVYLVKAKNTPAKAKLKQTLTLTAGQISAGQTLTLSGYSELKKGGKSKVKLDVDGVTVLNQPLTQSDAFQPFTLTTAPLAAVPQTITVKFVSKFESGKVRLDAVTLTVDAGRTLTLPALEPLALPSVP